MTIEIGYFFNDIYSSTYRSSISVMFTNILYLSIMVSTVIILIICATYPARRNTPIYVAFRLVFYIFASVLMIMTVHRGLIEKQFEDKYTDKTNKDVLEFVRGGDNMNSIFGTGKKIKVPLHHTEHGEEEPDEEVESGEGKVVGASVDEMLAKLDN